MPPFAITPCTLPDGPQIARNNVLAFWTDATWVQCWRGKPRDYVAAQAAKRGKANLLRDRAHRRHLIAVDEGTGEVVGYARWLLPCSVEATGESEGIGKHGGKGCGCEALWREGRVPDVEEEVRVEAERESAGADWEVDDLGGLDGPIRGMERRLLEGRRYMVLDYLCVPPEFRRRGIASALVRRGLEETDRLGLDTFVMSMRAGVSVYQKAGFVLLDHVLIDASSRGGDRDYGAWFLERKCTSREGDEPSSR
ncbi:Acyl-CoA N-acyltransferase [Coniochaeta hoffmannii]|uniref:Acyl-CoA N-acyltransferase n=1 Tax=Coniochaeta hoffmannii TaxID=91930 RepID=A0AA38VUH3_9PEZI|nr:Acyl-CoA N-acyltransferase [Coniochaeta hoffmannii]